MAKRKGSLPNRLMNFGLFLLAFSRPLTLLFGPGSMQQKTTRIINEATFNTAGGGKFDLSIGLRMYTPPIAAFALFEVKKMAMKKFRF